MGLMVRICLPLSEIGKLFSTWVAPFCIPISNVGEFWFFSTLGHTCDCEVLKFLPF